METVEEARKIFDKDRFAAAAGCEILEVGVGYARCQMKVKDNILNGYNQVMGGAIFTLADFTFAVASDSIAVSTNGNISYLSATKGDTLYAEAKVVKDGRTQVVYQIMVTDNLQKEIALVTMSGIKVR